MDPFYIEPQPQGLSDLKTRASMIAAGILSGPGFGGFVDEKSAGLGILRLRAEELARISAELAVGIETAAETAWKRRNDDVTRAMAIIGGGN